MSTVSYLMISVWSRNFSANNFKFTGLKMRSRQAMKSASILDEEEKLKSALECVKLGQWPNLKVEEFEGRGRGLVATRSFPKGTLLCHYSGTIYKGKKARSFMKEAYNAYQSCYMFECPYQGKYYVIDASTEDGSQGRLINHGLHGNVQPTPMIIEGHFYIFFKAKKIIEDGEEIIYDYGQRANKSNNVFPWLNTCTCTICTQQGETSVTSGEDHMVINNCCQSCYIDSVEIHVLYI